MRGGSYEESEVGRTDRALSRMRADANDDPAALSNLAAELLNSRPYAPSTDDRTLEAVAVARRAVARDPYLTAARFNLALALKDLGFAEEARLEFRKAAKADAQATWAGDARQYARMRCDSSCIERYVESRQTQRHVARCNRT
jgi:tetratricopeptide (TPR) repeat protein